MSHEISENPIYDGQTYYDSETEPISLATVTNTEVNCLKRLQMELAYKNYYNQDDLVTFLDENGLNPMETYYKNIHYVNMLKTVIAVLQALSNNINMYMKVEMNFGSRSEAYSNLQKRINDIKSQIKEVEIESQDKKSDFSFMFYTRELTHD